VRGRYRAEHLVRDWLRLWGPDAVGVSYGRRRSRDIEYAKYSLRCPLVDRGDALSTLVGSECWDKDN